MSVRALLAAAGLTPSSTTKTKDGKQLKVTISISYNRPEQYGPRLVQVLRRQVRRALGRGYAIVNTTVPIEVTWSKSPGEKHNALMDVCFYVEARNGTEEQEAQGRAGDQDQQADSQAGDGPRAG